MKSIITLAFSLDKKTLILFLVFFAFGFNSVFSQTCSSELSVEKNRNVRSAYKNKTSFTLFLKNTSSKSTKYILDYENSQVSCDNADRKSLLANVRLDVQFSGEKLVEGNTTSVTLNPGETFQFKASVTVLDELQFKRWGCTNIIVRSDACEDIVSQSLLRVYVPDPSEN